MPDKGVQITAKASPCEHVNCGCSHGALCCLDCPLAQCVHDLSGGELRAANVRERDRAALALYSSGMSAANVAAVQGVTAHAVHDRLKRARA